MRQDAQLASQEKKRRIWTGARLKLEQTKALVFTAESQTEDDEANSNQPDGAGFGNN